MDDETKVPPVPAPPNDPHDDETRPSVGPEPEAVTVEQEDETA